jgi:hypothetical protein
MCKLYKLYHHPLPSHFIPEGYRVLRKVPQLTFICKINRIVDNTFWNKQYQNVLLNTVIPRLTKIICFRITFISRNVIKSEAACVIRHLTSRCLECKQPSWGGGSPLCNVVSSFLCHTHTDGKDVLLEWPDRSCLLLYVKARIN